LDIAWIVDIGKALDLPNNCRTGWVHRNKNCNISGDYLKMNSKIYMYFNKICPYKTYTYVLYVS